MLRRQLANEIRPFARRRDPDGAAALAIGEAQGGKNSAGAASPISDEKRLDCVVEAAAVDRHALGGFVVPAARQDMQT